MASRAAAPVTALTPARASHGFATTWDSDGESSAPPTTAAKPARGARATSLADETITPSRPLHWENAFDSDGHSDGYASSPARSGYASSPARSPAPPARGGGAARAPTPAAEPGLGPGAPPMAEPGLGPGAPPPPKRHSLTRLLDSAARLARGRRDSIDDVLQALRGEARRACSTAGLSHSNGPTKDQLV